MQRVERALTEEEHDALARGLASERQLEYLDAVKAQGTQRKAAAALGVNQSVISRSLAGLERRVSETRTEPHRDPDKLPAGYINDGFSTMRRIWDPESGQWVIQWHKTRRDPNAPMPGLFESMRDLLEGFNTEPAIPDPGLLAKDKREDLMVVIPIGDFHFGMYAWGAEAGSDYDLKIAERNWRAAFDLIVDAIPHVDLIVLLNLGDLTHADNSKNATPGHGHQLDVDTRHPKVTGVALRCMLYAAHRLRTKGTRVRVRNNIGNHDPETSHAISLMMEAHFNGIEIEGIAPEPKPESRVEVMTSPKDLEIVATFGKVMITSSHGEHTKPADIVGLLVDDFREAVGAHPLIFHHSGHVHHKQRHHEVPGLGAFESHRTLTPKDKYSAQKYRSPQSIEAITYHREYGEDRRYVMPIERVHAAIKAQGS